MNTGDAAPNRYQSRSSKSGRRWESDFARLIVRALGADRGESLARRFLAAFGDDYRARTRPKAAVRDCLAIAALSPDASDHLELRRPDAGEASYRVQLISRHDWPLDCVLPMLQHLGLSVLDQMRFKADCGDAAIFLRSFSVLVRGRDQQPLSAVAPRLIPALRALMDGVAVDDRLNELIVTGGLSWPEVTVLRAYCHYAGQLGGLLRRERAERALIEHPAVAFLLFRYFEARFDPEREPQDLTQREENLLEPLRVELAGALSAVESVSDDRALRELFNLIDATLRTNYYLNLDTREFTLAIKMASLGVIDMAAPRPALEIFVHATTFEGIHLRGARVARGGIRWSEREDLRSEILNLQQTQMIKNSLIVPQGAKGGFVLKSRSGDRNALGAAGLNAYRRFIRALLEVTDKSAGTECSQPPAVLAYDAPDPYLVVAADKGTAAFSDVANEVAEQSGFWLLDAFASGGTRGYSHKRFGITARGAWECCKSHFRQLGRDIDQEGISVVGIGSMDGDVFGNGMLLSAHILLLGAFSSDHIFLDPRPDPATAFRERQRLFAMNHSTWDSYDRSLISAGGGVFSRTDKRIRLTAEVRSWLGVRYATIDGEGLVRLLLCAPVDLLWFGGIGTFVKSDEERDEQVGDSANDAVRVDASQVRAQVIAEGANLGLTQQARVEYAQRGGRINMDAIDNSAGVDLSDHEVNLKILLRQLAADGLFDIAERDAVLEGVAAEVCQAVLAHNSSQSLCLSLDQARCAREPESFLVLAQRLMNLGLLDPQRVGLPDRGEVFARRDPVLTRPELTLLLAGSKLALKSLLAAERDVFDPAAFEDWYQAYFPHPIACSFQPHLGKHPLAYEITVSQICNTIVDRAGAGFLTWLEEPSPQQMGRAVSLYRLFDQMLGAGDHWHAVRASPALTPAEETRQLLDVEDALASLCQWGLRSPRRVALDAQVVARWRADWLAYQEGVAKLAARRPSNSRAPDSPARAESDTALFGGLDAVKQFPYVVELKRRAGCSMDDACMRYFQVADWFGWPLLARAPDDPSADYRYRLARRTIGHQLLDRFGRLGFDALRASTEDPRQYLDELRKRGQLTRTARLRQELAGASSSALLEILILIADEAEAAVDVGSRLLEDL